MQKRGKGKNIGYSCMNPTPSTRILHPILHPKSLENTSYFPHRCRKCRRFSQNFFERIFTEDVAYSPRKTKDLAKYCSIENTNQWDNTSKRKQKSSCRQQTTTGRNTISRQLGVLTMYADWQLTCDNPPHQRARGSLQNDNAWTLRPLHSS